MFGLFLYKLVGAILWTLANVVYYDLKRKGVRGFGRFAAFWVGTPTTWITFFCVREGRYPTFEPPPDDEGALLAEIRSDRALRAAAEQTGEAAGTLEVTPED
jgi:hypothetical protein